MNVSHWLLHTSADLSKLERLWRELSAGATVFQQFELAQEWAAVFAHDCEFRVWYAPEGRVIAPFVIRGHRELSLLGDGMFDYCDLIGDGGEDLPPLREAIGTADGWHSLQATGVRADSKFLGFWDAIGVERRFYSAAPVCAGFELAPFDRMHRKASDRLRTLERRGAQLKYHTDAAERMELLSWTLQKKDERMRQLQQRNVLGGREQQWLSRMVEAHPQLIELWSLSRQERRMAGFITWAQPGVRYGYTLSFDPEFGRDSPGVLLLYGVLRQSMAEKRRFDMLTGQQDFKKRFANSEVPIFQVRGSRAASIQPVSAA